MPLPQIKGHAVAEAVSHQPLNAEVQVQSQASPCRIAGGTRGNGTGFSPRTSVFSC
jgi:hypothetical protein